MRLSYLQPTNWMYSMRSEWESTPTTESRLEVDIPGLEKKEDVTIKIGNDNVLSISGTINMANEVKDDHMYTQERFTSRFIVPSVCQLVWLLKKKRKPRKRMEFLRFACRSYMNRTVIKKIDVEFH